MKFNSFTFGALGLALWAVLMLVLVYPHDLITLANAPVLLILVSSVYSLLLPLSLSLILSAMAVVMFNYQMVPPVHTFHVDLHEHGILLITMMGVSWLVTYLLRRQKQIAVLERQQAQRTLQLMQWSEALREVDEPHSLLPRLHELISGFTDEKTLLVLGFQAPLLPQLAHQASLSSLQQDGFKACLGENKALGNGTGRYENLEDLYLPMRGKAKAYGVCVLLGLNAGEITWVPDAQALLDQMGLACERKDSLSRAQQARELAQNQKIQSLFLTSIAHDQRTPLASIMTAASAILEQGEQLSKAEVRQHAELIHAETQQVARLTDNTLTLARLSGEQVQVPMQLESVEDMVAAVLQRIRQRISQHGPVYVPKVKVQADLPLLNCNMVLVEQVLDNLIDNAIKHSGAPETVELNVHRVGNSVLFEVSDQGQGAQFSSLEHADRGRGLGIGLKLCHAVAQVHRGTIHSSGVTAGGIAAGFAARFELPIPTGHAAE